MIKQETIMEFSLKGALIERKRCIWWKAGGLSEGSTGN